MEHSDGGFLIPAFYPASISLLVFIPEGRTAKCSFPGFLYFGDSLLCFLPHSLTKIKRQEFHRFLAFLYICRKKMRDCWLDPYGNVYYVEPFGHEAFAREQLSSEFPMENETTPLREGPLGIDTWEERGYYLSFDETLMRRGWVRYTSTSEQWCYGRDWGGWEIYPRPTRAQRDKMFDLTGEIVE